MTPDDTPLPAESAAPRQGTPAHVVAFCADAGSALSPILSTLAAQGARITTVALRHLPLEWFDNYATSYDIALVDADALGDKVDMIDFGMRLRRFAPELPVIMLSARIAANDTTTERMAFCDVTLRLPVAEVTLFESLSIALENHAYWRDSRFESRLLAPRNRPRPPPPPAA